MPAADLDVRAVESLLAFWAEAGADTCFEAEPVDRLAEALKPVRPVAAASRLTLSLPTSAGETPCAGLPRARLGRPSAAIRVNALVARCCLLECAVVAGPQ